MSERGEGHLFMISVLLQGHGANWVHDTPMTLNVRAWSLHEAMRTAAEVPLAEWGGMEDDEDEATT